MLILIKTVVYLIRHSEPLKDYKIQNVVLRGILLENQRQPLSVNGERMALNLAMRNDFMEIDGVWSSNYVKAVSTAKYFAYVNGLKVNIDEGFNERVHGVESWDELSRTFEENQFNDENYKVGFGESQAEVRERMERSLMDIVGKLRNRKIVIISHATAMMFLLKKWCDIEWNGNYMYKGKVIFDGKWNYLEGFKLTIDGDKLIDIKKI